MGAWWLFLLGPVCCVYGVESLTCPTSYQSTILGTCADVNECQGSAPCVKGTCKNTNGNFYCDDQQSINMNFAVACGSVTCTNFARCENNTCICQPGYTGPTCNVKLSCDKMCRNNGTCDFQGTREVCICSSGFTGSECQYTLNICAPPQSVCLNNGSCVFGQFDTFPSCQCQGGYEGLFCEASNCSSLCYPSNSNPACGGNCSCNSSYYGDSCEYTYNCGCQNGGISVPDDATSCRCVCPEGTSGATCSMNTTNECSSSPCQNGGTCVDEIGFYTCRCPAEFSGYNCDIRCELDRNCLWKDCMQCKNKFDDGICDSECNNELCLFDGFDCYPQNASMCNGTYDNGTAILDLSDQLCIGLFDDNICVSNGTKAQTFCQNETCGSDGLDCLDNKRNSSNVLGVLVVDFIIKSGGVTNETVLNESTPTLFKQILPYNLNVKQGFPGFFIRRLTSDPFSVGTGALMINPSPDFATSLKYRVFYNVVNKPSCNGASSLPCWSNITSVSRYVALTATSLLSTYVDSFTELFTCMDGYYGSRCAMKCSSMCQTNSAGRTCEMDSGKCISGCSSNSYTGDNCDIMCSSNCIDMCSSSDGTCVLTSNSTRCKAGYQGMYCNKTCDMGTYGIDCVFNCSTNCVTGTCDSMTGYCTCMAGYDQTDRMCRTECSSGTYGTNCTGICNPCGMGLACNKVDGSCSSCPEGKTGNMCSQDCPDNYYGSGCAEKCSANCATTCNKINGTCSPCTKGYEGMYCTTKTKSNDATLADPTSDMQATIIAVVIIIVCLLVIAFLVAFILWRRNQGAEYELNEVEPLEDKKRNGESGITLEMENINAAAVVENEKENGGESIPLLEHTDKVNSDETAPTQPKGNTSSETSPTSPSTESTENYDTKDTTSSDKVDDGLKLDFKYIDGVESKDTSLEDVRDQDQGEGTPGTMTLNSYLETDIDTAQKTGE